MKGEMFARILFLVVGVMFCFMWVVGGVSAVNPSEETYVSWTISSGGGWWCDTDDGVWRNGSNVIENNCSKYASVNNGFACCKDNIQCNSDGNCYGRVQYCWQYDNNFSCNVGKPNTVRMNNVDYACGETIVVDGCAKTYSCSCIWNNSESISTKRCADVFKIINESITTPSNPPAACEGGGVCTWSTEIIENHCNDSLNYVLVEKKESWSPISYPQPDWCKNLTREDTCPIIIKLPFFGGNLMLFVSVCLVIIVYLARGTRRNNKLVCP